MTKANVAVSLDEGLLNRLDRLVRKAVFPNRSQAIQVAVEEKLERVRIAWECARLDPDYEKSIAETIVGENQPDQNTGC
jgi:Arc/MetJ-type ribon-helix-helix transcriptional regulator